MYIICDDSGGTKKGKQPSSIGIIFVKKEKLNILWEKYWQWFNNFLKKNKLQNLQNYSFFFKFSLFKKETFKEKNEFYKETIIAFCEFLIKMENEKIIWKMVGIGTKPKFKEIKNNHVHRIIYVLNWKSIYWKKIKNKAHIFIDEESTRKKLKKIFENKESLEKYIKNKWQNSKWEININYSKIDTNIYTLTHPIITLVDWLAGINNSILKKEINLENLENIKDIFQLK